MCSKCEKELAMGAVPPFHPNCRCVFDMEQYLINQIEKTYKCTMPRASDHSSDAVRYLVDQHKALLELKIKAMQTAVIPPLVLKGELMEIEEPRALENRGDVEKNERYLDI